MDKKEALKIIRMIADGEDPYKDEGRPEYLPEHNPKTLKALCRVISSIFPVNEEESESILRQPLILKKRIKSPIEDFLKQLEKDAIIEALKKACLKLNKAAEILEITHSELLSKIEEHDIADYLKKLEKDAIIEALTKTNFKKDEAAAILEITYPELLNKIKKHDINKELLLFAIETDYQDQLNHITLDEYLEMIEANAILKALEKAPLKQDAAELLGTSFRTLRYRIDKFSGDIENISNSIPSPVRPDFFKHSWRGASLDEFLKTIEKKVIEMALEETDLKQDAAELLGISFRTLRYRIDKLGIE